MSFSMSNLIEKLNARDKDERYMAMHDLAADLDRDNIKHHQARSRAPRSRFLLSLYLPPILLHEDLSAYFIIEISTLQFAICNNSEISLSCRS